MLWLKRARNEGTEEYVLHPSLKLRRIVSGLPAPDRQISVAPACRLMPAPRAVPFLDLEDMEIPCEHDGKIVGNVRAKHSMRNELMSRSELETRQKSAGFPTPTRFGFITGRV
jgi:hypothetical protein